MPSAERDPTKPGHVDRRAVGLCRSKHARSRSRRRAERTTGLLIPVARSLRRRTHSTRRFGDGDSRDVVAAVCCRRCRPFSSTPSPPPSARFARGRWARAARDVDRDVEHPAGSPRGGGRARARVGDPGVSAPVGLGVRTHWPRSRRARVAVAATRPWWPRLGGARALGRVQGPGADPERRAAARDARGAPRRASARRVLRCVHPSAPSPASPPYPSRAGARAQSRPSAGVGFARPIATIPPPSARARPPDPDPESRRASAPIAAPRARPPPPAHPPAHPARRGPRPRPPHLRPPPLTPPPLRPSPAIARPVTRTQTSSRRSRRVVLFSRRRSPQFHRRLRNRFERLAILALALALARARGGRPMRRFGRSVRRRLVRRGGFSLRRGIGQRRGASLRRERVGRRGARSVGRSFGAVRG